MNRINVLFLFVASTSVASLLTSCATKPTTHTVTAAENGSIVHLASGDLLQVRLGDNPSTGYGWHTQEINPWVLARTERPNFQPGSGPNPEGTPLVGAEGTLTLDYRAVGPGTSPLILNHVRAWETNLTPDHSFELTVMVK